MLHYIRGLITMRFDGGVVVETGGVGYMVYVPDNSPLYSETGNDPVLVYTAMLVREDDMSLYGFHNIESLKLFQKLRTVNGVGAKAALAILSVMPLGEVKKAILFEDAASLTRANGIGKKTAQRIVLELKDKIGDIGGYSDIASIPELSETDTGMSEAVNALIGLGFSKSEAVSALAGIEGENLKAEDCIKYALRGISKR